MSEFGFYFFIRQVVNLFEWLLAWRGHKRVLRAKMRTAKNYSEWRTAARNLDEYLGFDDWKETDQDSYFDAVLVRRVRSTLSRLRAAKDTRGVMDALAICVRPNFAGTESSRMYKETFYGTKRLVESHINEVVASLDYVRSATDVTPEEKRTFFRAINKNYGSSALCLSGGASFGYYHFGIIKSFLEADLLPRVITGTSAGGLIAAFVCTHTDAELKQLIRPELADKITACEDPIPVYVKRWWKTGARFSALDWARKVSAGRCVAPNPSPCTLPAARSRSKRHTNSLAARSTSLSSLQTATRRRFSSTTSPLPTASSGRLLSRLLLFLVFSTPWCSWPRTAKGT